jgi:uncharacterized membrane protein required for colicin V production
MEMMGNFAGAKFVASAGLFLAGVVVAVVPGWIVSKMAGAFCVGGFDKLLGIFMGLIAGLIAITLAFMVALPHFPRMERSAAWRDSKFARPLCNALEHFFSHPSKHRASITQELKEGITDQVTPIVQKTPGAVRETANGVEHTVAKKATAVKKAVTGAK